MKRLFLLAGVVAAMISCAQSDVYDINESNPDVIAFDTYVDQTTKGTVFTNETVKETGFGLMAYYTAQDAWLEGGSASAPDFMYNQMVGYSGSAWSYTPLKYWPNEDDDKVTFFAYAPYEKDTNGVKASYTANTATGLPKIDFTVQDEAVDMIDFVAGQNMDMVRQQDKVVFNLKHQLARATFSAITNVDNTSYGATANGDIKTAEDGYSYVVVKSMDIINGIASNFYTHAIYEFDYETTNTDKTDHSQDGIWTIDATSAKDYSFATIMDYDANGYDSFPVLEASTYNQTGVVLPMWKTAYTSLFTTGQYLFLIPPAGADGMAEGSEIQVEIVYDIVTVDAALELGYSATESTYTVTLPAGTLAQGKAYNYQLTFDVTEVLVDVNIVDWDEEITSDAGTVDPFDDSIENPIATLSIGDDQTIYAGETITLTPSVTYTEEGDSEDTLTWSCSLDYISITKNEDGSLVVTGKQAGATTITLTSKSGESASVEITVVSSEYSYTTPEGGNLEIGETFTPEAADGVEIPADLTITWSSSDAEIVSVDSETGVITAVAAGTATITGTDQYGNVVFKYSVTVVAATVYVDKVEITTGESGTVTEGDDPFTLAYALSPDGINSEYSVLWESSVQTVATVDQNGEVTIVGAGETTITVTITDADGKTYADSYLLTVEAAAVPVADVTISGDDTIDMATATTFTYTAEVEPSTATDSTVTWAVVSGDATIKDGVLTPTATGTVVISATAGDVTVEKKITVTTSALIEINFGGDPEDEQIIATTSNLLNGQFDATISGTSLTSVVWSADNDEVLLINSATGEFTITGSGYVTITAEVAGTVDTLYVGVSVDGFTIGGDIVGGDSENVPVGGNQ